jgi:hypothetical protein
MPGGIRIELDGDERLIAKLRELNGLARSLALDATRQSVDVVKNRMIEGIASPPKMGRIYRGRFPYVFGQEFIPPEYRRPPHQASAEGEYPASDTGNLIRSIWAEVEDELAGLAADSLDTQLSFNLNDLVAAENTINGLIGADAEYAAPLEYKPPERGGRPFATRALSESRDDIYAIFLGMRGKFGGGGGGAPPTNPPTSPTSPPPAPPRPPSGFTGSNEGQPGFSAEELNAQQLRNLLNPPPDGSSPP